MSNLSLDVTDKLAESLKELVERLDPYDYPDEQGKVFAALAEYEAMKGGE